MKCHVLQISLFCPACTSLSFRSRFVPTAREPGGRHEMSCFVVFRGIACLSMPGLSCIVSPSRSPPPGSGTLFRAYRARGGGRPLAPARFARLIAPARARARDPGRGAHVSRRFLKGLFAPARTGGRGGPARMPLLFSRLISERASRCQSFSGNNSNKKRTNDCNRIQLSDSPPACGSGRSVRPGHSTAMSAAATRRSSAISTL